MHITKPGWMQYDGEAEFDHGDETYFAHYITDVDLGKSYITEVYYCPDGVTITPAPAELMPLAVKAMEKDIERTSEQAMERALSGGPSMSYQEIQSRNRMEKDGFI